MALTNGLAPLAFSLLLVSCGSGSDTSAISAHPKEGSAASTSALKQLPDLHPEEDTALRGVEINYSWDDRFNRCNGATALSKGVLIATAQVRGIAGNRQSGYYIDVEELHYAPGTQEITYRGTLRFRIGLRGTKVAEMPISGVKQRDIFREWPTGR